VCGQASRRLEGQGHEALAATVERVYNRDGPVGSSLPSEIVRFFGGWELVGPGSVYAPLWRPYPADDLPDQPERFWQAWSVSVMGALADTPPVAARAASLEISEAPSGGAAQVPDAWIT
jgi:S-adenosyl methyltransferase